MNGVLEVLLWVVAAVWVVFFVQVILNRLLMPNLIRTEPRVDGDWPSVSIVVPARNEERSVRQAVTSFCKQDYPNLEVIVVEDRSTDATPHILAELQREFSNLKVVHGQDPPAGWLGKPNALETGRKAATGEWVLFVDADLVYEPDALRRAVAYATREDVGLLCLWPRLVTGEVVEAALMSSLPLVGLGLAPIYLINRSRKWPLVPGGGAGNLVRREALEACGAFESLRDAVVDDIGLASRVKVAGYRVVSILAREYLKVRMYEGTRATINGFVKHTYAGVIRRPWLLPMPIVVGFVLGFLPYVGFIRAACLGSISVPALVGLVFMHLALGFAAVTIRLPWYVAFLNPLREVGWWWIVVRSYVSYRRNGLVWRGRAYASS
ncbi:MAG TPA: glycosyltransferase [Phycisphaerae bacterium]|nr:glycosyltransferase [Phycisphaerae bacterium]